MSEQPADQHVRPEGVDDATVEALGKLSEALEVVEEARGLLYAFHRRCGEADLKLGNAVDLLRDAVDTCGVYRCGNIWPVNCSLPAQSMRPQDSPDIGSPGNKYGRSEESVAQFTLSGVA